MVEIQLYQPGVLNETIQFPQSWEELSGPEVLEVAKGLLVPETGRHKMLIGIIGNRVGVSIANHLRFLDAEQLVLQGLPLMNFVYEDITLVEAAEPSISLPNVKIAELYAPYKAFEKLTCAEFEDCEQCFFAFTENPSPEPLADLAAILYRPKNQPYVWLDETKGLQTYESAPLARSFLKLEEHRLYAIYLWYVGCRSLLPRFFPVMHEPSEDGEEETNPSMSFVKCIHAGAGPKNGTRDKIRMLKLFEFLYDMEQEAIKHKELKAFYANQK